MTAVKKMANVGNGDSGMRPNVEATGRRMFVDTQVGAGLVSTFGSKLGLQHKYENGESDKYEQYIPHESFIQGELQTPESDSKFLI